MYKKNISAEDIVLKKTIVNSFYQQGINRDLLADIIKANRQKLFRADSLNFEEMRFTINLSDEELTLLQQVYDYYEEFAKHQQVIAFPQIKLFIEDFCLTRGLTQDSFIRVGMQLANLFRQDEMLKYFIQRVAVLLPK